MEFNEIYAIIKKLVKSGAAEVSFETKDLKLSVKNHPKYPTLVNVQPGGVSQAQDKSIIAPPQSPKDKLNANQGQKIIKSPMVGIFYRKPSPEKPPYVNVGDVISKGTIICIIEAMKLFNEIESEFSGKIVQTLVDDGTPVEYDQPLFLVE